MAAIADDFVDMVERSLVVGFGPQGADNGAAIYLPSAYLTNDPSAYDVGVPRTRG